jgi:HD-like signal output (HDOD) protein
LRIAGVLLYKSHHQPHVVHITKVAIVCELLARKLQHDWKQRVALIAAAFTMNIGMLAAQVRIDQSTSKLSDADKKIINNHPLSSAKVLQAHGVKNSAWIKAVLFHHERMDGGGYPKGIEGGQIPLFSRIMHLADVFTASLSHREHRPAMPTINLVKHLMSSYSDCVDSKLLPTLLKIVGMYPAGTFLLLKNKSLVIVLKQSAQIKKPFIQILQDEDGNVAELGVSDEDYEVAKILPQSKDNYRVDLDLNKLWGYDNESGNDNALLPSNSLLKTSEKIIVEVKLPSIPEVMSGIRKELAKEEPNIDTIADLVSEDISLSGSLMKLVNSPATGMKKKITSIKHGLMVLGVKKFYGLIFVSAVQQVMALEGDDPVQEALWAHSTAMSYGASRLSEFIQDQNPDEAYLGGLLTYSGQLLMTKKFSDYADTVLPLMSDNPLGILQKEQKQYKINHSVLSFVLSQQWQVPENLSLAVYHYRTSTPEVLVDTGVRALAFSLALARYLIDDIVKPDNEDPEALRFRIQATSELMIEEDDLLDIQDDIRRNFPLLAPQ